MNAKRANLFLILGLALIVLYFFLNGRDQVPLWLKLGLGTAALISFVLSTVFSFLKDKYK